MSAGVIAAIVFSVAVGLVVAFEVALTMGVPWGEFAMGGRHPGTLTRSMRVATAIQALVLLLMAAVILARAGVILDSWSRSSVSLAWAVVAYCLVAVVLNSISPSAGERRIWVPVATVMLVSGAIVAMS